MLIICEKPSVAKEFSSALGCKIFSGGCYRNDKHVITYCVGHLYRLWDPGDYREEWKKWSADQLPIIPAEYRYRKNTETAGQADIVNGLIKSHLDKDILIATDAGREGELIARIALREAGLKDLSRCRRFWVSEALTPGVIRDGISSAKPLSEYNSIAGQGFARQHADWLVGMNLSRYITLNGGSGEVFSVGRVQSAVLSAVVSRHERAVNFVSSPYNEAEALIEDAGGISVKALLVHPGTQKTDFSLNDPYLVKAVAYAQSHSKEVTAEVTTVKKIRKPEKLFNLTALQKEAYKLCGYSPDESLTIAQALYEKHKCLSYPRTPSRVMGDNSVELFREKFNLLAGKYARWSRFSVPALIDRSNRHIFNSAALEDHHALIPLAYLPEGADSKEKNVFEIVVKQFFVACMGDYVWNEHRYEIKNGPYTYRAVTREPVEAGWKAVFERGKEGEDIPEAAGKLDTGSCYIRAVTVLDKKTSPPKLFRLDTLLAFMERPEAAEGGTGKPAGLGTSATRAEIIKNLFDKKYILEEKKQLIPTGKGEWLIRRLGSDKELSKMADAGETAEWERRLEEDPGSFEQSIIGYVKTSIKPGNGMQCFEKEPVGICPVCGNKVYEGRNGYFCSSRDNKNKPCQFSLWKIVAGARVTAGDAKQLLLNKSTGVKECVSKKTGKKFKACFHLNKAGEVEFIFRESTGKRKTKG